LKGYEEGGVGEADYSEGYGKWGEEVGERYLVVGGVQ
jgi:hypothetical protein